MNELRENIEFERIYTEFSEKVSRYIRGKISNAHDAEDLTSDVFVKIFNGFAGFDREKASLSTWIYTITRNTVVDYFRASKRFCELPEGLSDEQGADEKILNEETLESLANALERLSGRERDVIVLHYYGEKTLKSIAGTMGISYGCAKLLHSGALRKLRKIFEETGG